MQRMMFLVVVSNNIAVLNGGSESENEASGVEEGASVDADPYAGYELLTARAQITLALRRRRIMERIAAR